MTMMASNEAPILVIGEKPTTFILEDYLKNFFFFNSPMDARLEIQHTKIYDLFSPDYKKEAQMLHELLYAYCAEHIDNFRVLESIIKKDIVISSGDSYAIDYHSIFLNLDDKGELAFFEGCLPLNTFVSRYRLLCAVDALVGIGNTFWALDNLRRFKIFLNERAANILIKESYAITRSLSAFYSIKMQTQLYKTEKDNSILQEEIIENMRKHSSEMRNARILNLKENMKKLQFAYKISKFDTRYYKGRAETAEQRLRKNSGTGGANKAFIDDLTGVVEIFLQSTPCVSLEKFKEAFAKQYHDGQPCAIGRRKYYISKEDGALYREGLENKHKEEYIKTPHRSLESAYVAAVENIKKRHPAAN